jgi:hypothetical protein
MPGFVGSRQLPIALRVGAVALWVVFMIGMVNWSNTYAAIVGAGVGTVALGLLVGRWWVLWDACAIVDVTQFAD